MPALSQIEKQLVSWHKNIPHLPRGSRQWIAENAWRMTIIGAGLSIYSMFALVPMIITSFVLTSSANIIAPNVPYYSDSLGWPWPALLVVAIVFFGTAVALAAAVYPIMQMHKRGWDLTFWAYASNVLLGVVTTLLLPSVLELSVVVVITLVAGYLLLEIRREFHPTK